MWWLFFYNQDPREIDALQQNPFRTRPVAIMKLSIFEKLNAYKIHYILSISYIYLYFCQTFSFVSFFSFSFFFFHLFSWALSISLFHFLNFTLKLKHISLFKFLKRYSIWRKDTIAGIFISCVFFHICFYPPGKKNNAIPKRWLIKAIPCYLVDQ